MKLYLAIIGACMAIISAVNAAFIAPMVGLSWWLPVLACVLLTVLVIAIDGGTAWLVNALPGSWMQYDQKIYSVSQKEKNFYEKIKIREWKDKVPELGGVKNFSKSKIADPFNNEYVETYLREICYGEWTHLLSLFTGFLILFFFPAFRWSVGLPVALVNFCLNIPPIFILRYNSYKLKILHTNNAKKAARRQEALQEVATTE